jgi:hypothetical protein
MKPMWFEQPKLSYIYINQDQIIKSPLGNEVSITLNVGSENCNVVIPLSALDEKRLTIPALQVGEINNSIILSFPPTSLGTSTCNVPKSQFEAWLAKEVK